MKAKFKIGNFAYFKKSNVIEYSNILYPYKSNKRHLFSNNQVSSGSCVLVDFEIDISSNSKTAILESLHENQYLSEQDFIDLQLLLHELKIL